MTSQITAETLTPITHNQTPVITTELLAQLYNTEAVRIRQNHSRNEDRFVMGKHYFLLDGEELREFKHRVSQSYSVKIARNVRSLILWTERGAARHAKMLETDQAWEVFERLEDCYFSQKDKKQSPVRPKTATSERYLVRVIIHDELFGGSVEILGKADSFRTIANGIATDLGYKPTSFISVPMNKENMKRLY